MKELLTPCLWYDQQARNAAKMYCTAFPSAKISSQSPIVTELDINGQKLILLDGGPMFRPNPSISLYVICETEQELDHAWSTLGEGGLIMMPLDVYPWSKKYGWVSDRFGVSWQLTLGSISDLGQMITPDLLFTGDLFGRADEALQYYTSIFKDSSISLVSRYDASQAPGHEGKINHAQLTIGNQKLILMESGMDHRFGFTEGVSLTVYCDTQEEVDYYWDTLTREGEESMCGWVKDKYGVSWQIVPRVLAEIMADPARAEKAVAAFMTMRKLDIRTIVEASLA